jgi:hypothetical protein
MIMIDETLDKCLSQKTVIDTSTHMPEVLQFGQLIDAVHTEYSSRCYAESLRSMQLKLCTLSPRFSRTIPNSNGFVLTCIAVRIQDSIRSFDEAHKAFRHNSLAMERMELLGKTDESWTGDLTQEVGELQITMDNLKNYLVT